MEHEIIDAGRAFFVNWDYMDKAAMRWAKNYFDSSFAKAKTEREDYTSCLVKVYDLDEADEEKFRALYHKYDVNGDYDIDADFAETEGGRYCSLPEPVSLGILQEMFPNLKVGTAVANSGGVLLLSEKVNVDSAPFQFPST